jgi:hypothetical protein
VFKALAERLSLIYRLGNKCVCLPAARAPSCHFIAHPHPLRATTSSCVQRNKFRSSLNLSRCIVDPTPCNDIDLVQRHAGANNTLTSLLISCSHKVLEELPRAIARRLMRAGLVFSRSDDSLFDPLAQLGSLIHKRRSIANAAIAHPGQLLQDPPGG